MMIRIGPPGTRVIARQLRRINLALSPCIPSLRLTCYFLLIFCVKIAFKDHLHLVICIGLCMRPGFYIRCNRLQVLYFVIVIGLFSATG